MHMLMKDSDDDGNADDDDDYDGCVEKPLGWMDVWKTCKTCMNEWA